jgi:ParB/RepB/Spo0J family partition protein
MRKSTDEIVEFDATRVRPLPDQPRKRFKGIQELADSIAEAGQMAPGLVTMIDGVGPYDAQLVDGERRLRACRLAGVPFRAIVRPQASEADTFVASFAANFGKQDHDVIEIAEGLARMQAAGKTPTQLARITGRSITWVHQHLNLLKLHADVRAMMVSEDDEPPPLTFQLAQSLVPLSADDQVKLAKKVTRGDGMSVAAARRMILKFRSDAGDDDVYGGGVGRPRSIRSIESMLEAITDKVGVYIDMPGADFNRIVDGLDQREKKTLVEAIQDVRQNLADLADSIEERRTAANRTPRARRQTA